MQKAREDWERLRVTEAGAVPLTDPTARSALQYLWSRGLALEDLPNDLRLHPRLRYYVKDPKTRAQVCTGIYPALLAVFRDALSRNPFNPCAAQDAGELQFEKRASIVTPKGERSDRKKAPPQETSLGSALLSPTFRHS